MSENENITFEDALAELEDIVHELEESGLTLEDALLKFETGVKLSRLCNKELDDAEMRIEQLTEGEDGVGAERVEIE